MSPRAHSIPRRPHAARGSSLRGLACGLLLSLAAGCSDAPASLDEVPTTTASLVASSDGADDTTGAPPPSIEICEPGCEPLLLPSWTHEGSPGQQRVAALLRTNDGSLWVGSERIGGGVEVSRLAPDGTLAWSLHPSLPCTQCALADLALHPSGDLLISASDRDESQPLEAILARFSLEAGSFAWTRIVLPNPSFETHPQAGPVAVLHDDRIVQLRRDGFNEETETIDLIDYAADGSIRDQFRLQTLPTAPDGMPSLMVVGPQGELVLAYPTWDDRSERHRVATVRRLPPDYGVLSQIVLPVPLDALAIDRAGHRLELGRSTSTESITLLLTSRSASDLPRWDRTLPLLSTSSTRADLAIGPDDDVYVAARTTPATTGGDPFVVQLSVARWSVDGALRFASTRPLDMMANPDPLELVIDDDDGVIVATIVLGRLHVVRYEQACACE